MHGTTSLSGNLTSLAPRRPFSIDLLYKTCQECSFDVLIVDSSSLLIQPCINHTTRTC